MAKGDKRKTKGKPKKADATRGARGNRKGDKGRKETGSKKTPKRGATKWTSAAAKIKVTKKQLEETADKLRKTLERADKAIPFPGRKRVSVHVNRDKTVDATLRVHLPRGVRATRLFKILSDQVSPVAGAWISVASRYSFRDEEDLYRRYKGMPETSVYWQKSSRAHVGTNFLTARRITEKVEKKRRSKAVTVLVNLHWNPEGKKPKR
jgi:hypothetical protein